MYLILVGTTPDLPRHSDKHHGDVGYGDAQLPVVASLKLDVDAILKYAEKASN